MRDDNIIELRPKPEPKPMTSEEYHKSFFEEMDKYMEMIRAVDKRVSINVRRMYLLAAIMPLMCCVVAGVTALVVRLVFEWAK